jgi:hypothetical protein
MFSDPMKATDYRNGYEGVDVAFEHPTLDEISDQGWAEFCNEVMPEA